MPKVIMDYRERNSNIKKELIKKGVEVEEKQLISGDFIIQTKNRNNEEIDVGIERKTNIDFLNSMIDKRILNQLITLKEAFTIPLLIIEGTENIYSLRNFHPNSIRGMLTSIAVDFQIPILYSKNYRDTAALISVISKRLEKPIRNLNLLKKKKPLTTKELQEYVVESLPGVGPSISKSLLTKFKTIKKVINAKEEHLKKIDKIGKKKAKNIKKIIEEEYNS